MECIDISTRRDTVDLDRLLHPAAHFRHPNEVVSDRTLSLPEKRALLSSWASDACAVASVPALRDPPGIGAFVSFDEVMEALKALDEETGTEPRPLDPAGRAASRTPAV